VPDRHFTVDEAQLLLDQVIRPLAERMVAIRTEAVPLEARWRSIVLAIGSNGGSLDREEATDLRAALERAQAEVEELLNEIIEHGVQVKDVDTGLLDFPTTMDGEEALLCWRVGEGRIEFWHTIDGGFAGRTPLE
jgi:hypothetical protein